jgi:hypothetical protein
MAVIEQSSELHPSLMHHGQGSLDETVAFKRLHGANLIARLRERRRAKAPVKFVGFSMQNRVPPHPFKIGCNSCPNYAISIVGSCFTADQ